MLLPSILLFLPLLFLHLARTALRTRFGPPLPAARQPPPLPLPPLPPPFPCGLANCRDLAASCAGLPPRTLFRGASPLALPPAAARRALSTLAGGRPVTVVDLRSESEWADAGAATAAALGARVVVGGGGKHGGDDDAPPIVVHRVALQEWRRFTTAFVARAPARRALPILAALAVARATRARPPVPYLRRRVLAAINEGGLPATYAAILSEFGGEVAAALRALTAAAAGGRAVVLACKLGKDRTGLLAALLLTVLGVPRPLVLADYAASAGAATADAAVVAAATVGAGVPSLAGAPPAALHAVLTWLDTAWGGVDGYLDGVGFGAAERDALRRVF